MRAIARLKPDVIAIESGVPLAESLHLTRRILRESPTPIVSVVVQPGHRDEDASRQLIESGVLSVVQTWRRESDLDDAAGRLCRTLKSMSRVQVIRQWAPPSSTRSGAVAAVPESCRRRHGPIDVVAIGASTGGPQALHELFSRLTATFTPPILVVQHMTPGFLVNMVDWLQASCPLPIQLAGHGVLLDRPGIYIAPSGST